MRQRQRAFSLIEILVVLVIVMVLAGMLLVVIPAVRSAAERARCASSLAQVGLGVFAYADEWHGALPYIQTPDLVKWTSRLAPILDQIDPNTLGQIHSRTSLLRGCPTFLASDEYDPGTPAWPNTWDTGYGQNVYPLRGDGPALDWKTNYYMNYTWSQWNAMVIYRSMVTRVSSRALVADAPNYWSWPNNAIAAGKDPRRRHRSGANCLFFDGRVGFLQGDALIAAHETP